MQSTGGRSRLSPSLQQSAVGLMILVSLGLMGGLVLWISNFSFGGRGYKATIVFPNAGGMTSGSRVAYRGVRVGRVLRVEPEPQGVAIEVEISPANLLIPSNSLVEVTQAGLVGESSIDITPLEPLPLEGVEAKPLDPDCNPDIIICNNSRLQGEDALNVNTLIRSMVRIAEMVKDPQVTGTIRSLTEKTGDALVKITRLSNQTSGFLEEVKGNGTIDQLNSTLRSTEQAAADIRGLSQNIQGLSSEATAVLGDVRQNNTIGQLNSTLTSLNSAAREIHSFIALNRQQIGTTLASIKNTSEQLSETVTRLDPILSEVEQGQILKNLEVMSANAAQLTTNLRDLSSNLNEPTSILMLQQTLDSARSAFQNLEKISSDVDEITGNPQIRRDLMRMIQGLSNLVSSTQNLQQQVQYTQMLSQFSAQIAPNETPKPTLLSPAPVKPATPVPPQP